MLSPVYVFTGTPLPEGTPALLSCLSALLVRSQGLTGHSDPCPKSQEEARVRSRLPVLPGAPGTQLLLPDHLPDSVSISLPSNS